MSKITIRPPKPGEFEIMLEEVKKDRGLMFHPSHFIAKNDEPIGFLSIGAAPIVGAYFNPRLCVARDSIKAIELAESFMRALGHKHYSLLCETESPFFPLLEKMGYKNIWPTNVMDKIL